MTKFILKTKSLTRLKQVGETNIDALLLDSNKIDWRERENWQGKLNSKTKIMPVINFLEFSSFYNTVSGGREDFPIAIVIPPKFNGLDVALTRSLNYFKSKFAVFSAPDLIGRDLSAIFEFLARFTFTAVIIELEAVDSVSCLHSENLDLVARMQRQSMNNDLQFGLLGAFEVPDIPRLVHLQLDYVGLSEKDKDSKFGKTIEFFGQYTALVERDRDFTIRETTPESFDKLIVRDFILPVAVGAYEHEHKETQKVCFNVVALVDRVSRRPQTMNDVISYDIIMDAIRRVISAGHHDLVETIAESVASQILTSARIRRVTIRVEKLELGPAAVGIEITRYRE